MNYRYFILSTLLITLACSGSNGNGNNLSDLGFYRTPDEILSSIKGETLSPAEHFLLGMTWKEKKDYKKALHHLANSCFTTFRAPGLKLYAQPVYRFVTSFHVKSDYYDDALYEIAGLFYLYREYDYVDKFLERVSKDNLPLYLQARLLKAQNHKHSGKTDQALAILETLLSDFTEPSPRSVILIKKASILEETGSIEKAASDYFIILSVNPDSWQATIAAEHLHLFHNKGAIILDDRQKQELGIALYHAQKYNESKQVLESVKDIAALPHSESFRYFIRTLARTGSTKDFGALTRKIKKEDEQDIQFVFADELWSMNRKYASIPYYKKLLQSDRDDIKRISLQRLAIYMEDRSAPGFTSYLLQYVNAYPRDMGSHTMLWLLGRHEIKNGRTREALQYLMTSDKNHPGGKYSDQCRFWLYKIRLQNSDKNGARSAALDLITKNPDSPYAWIVAEKLAAQESRESLDKHFAEARKEKDPMKSLFYHSLLFLKEKDFQKRNARLQEMTDIRNHYEKLDSLLVKAEKGSRQGAELPLLEKYARIGNDEAIQRTCSLLPKDKHTEAEKNALLATLGLKYHNYFYAVYYSQELLKTLSMQENIFIQPEKAVRMLLPESFPQCLQTYTGEYPVEKNMVLSVIKAESLFNHKAISSAGAVGLMQLMPPTAKDLARELGIKSFDLKNPCTSIQFGTRYLAWLRKFFNNNFTYMVAGYNAGAGNVQKWRQKFSSQDEDFFTEFIPFLETRYYILRTGKFLTQYDCVYGR